MALPRTNDVPANEAATRGFAEPPARRAARTVGVVRKSEVAIVSFESIQLLREPSIRILGEIEFIAGM